MSHVPVIDVAGLTSDDPRVRSSVAAEIGEACRTIGFLSVTGHGVPDEVIDAAFAATRQVFDLSFDEKMKSAWDDQHPDRGYDPPGSQRLGADAAPDLKEAWAFSPERFAGSSRMHGANQWPDLPSFRAPIERYHNEAMRLCERILGAMALSLDLDEHHFAEFHQQPICTLRIHHYPPRPDDAAENEFGTGAHTDWGAVTVLAQDASGSLQVKAKDGSWVDVPPTPGAFVINVGDLLSRWTNDRYVSTEHRVLGVPGVDRHSIACFFDLDEDAVIEVLPTCISAADPARYGPITAGDYIEQRFLASIS
ncbi:MAG: 2-oxoglutarate and iron-dependent oxygenase domain-containing protein [Acidimicrobiales bacterium]